MPSPHLKLSKICFRKTSSGNAAPTFRINMCSFEFILKFSRTCSSSVFVHASNLYGLFPFGVRFQSTNVVFFLMTFFNRFMFNNKTAA